MKRGQSPDLQSAGDILRGEALDIATREEVPPRTRVEIEAFVRERLEALLPEAFPERALRVERDGPIWKIVGELGLGGV